MTSREENAEIVQAFRDAVGDGRVHPQVAALLGALADAVFGEIAQGGDDQVPDDDQTKKATPSTVAGKSTRR